MKNPIIDNRIVNDYTFATRLRFFLDDIQPSCMAGQEELEYLISVADKLKTYQIETMPKEEEWYHINCRNI
jgi:hypothetical protein